LYGSRGGPQQGAAVPTEAGLKIGHSRRGKHDARLLLHTSFLPCLTEHLLVTGEGELAVALSRKSKSNRQQASPEGDQDNDDLGVFL
jgi:hypothetical protein